MNDSCIIQMLKLRTGRLVYRTPYTLCRNTTVTAAFMTKAYACDMPKKQGLHVPLRVYHVAVQCRELNEVRLKDLTFIRI
jgi:hypothetical protein